MGAYIGADINAIKIKNLLTGGNFSDASYWSTYMASISVSGNIATTKGTGAWPQLYRENIPTTAGHVYYVRGSVSYAFSGSIAYPGRIDLKIGNASENVIGSYDVDQTSKSDGTWYHPSVLTTWGEGSMKIVLALPNTNANGSSVSANVFWKEVMLIDLTDAFGAGNEPTREWCNENLPFIEEEIVLVENAEEVEYHEVEKMYLAEANPAPVFRPVEEAYMDVEGVWRKVFPSVTEPHIGFWNYDDRGGTSFEQTIRDSGAVYCFLRTTKASSSWTGCGFGLCDENGDRILFPAGTVIQYSFTGARTFSTSSDYVIAVASEDGTRFMTDGNATASNKTYTLPQSGGVEFFAQTAAHSTGSVRIEVTSLVIDGVVIIPGAKVAE